MTRPLAAGGFRILALVRNLVIVREFLARLDVADRLEVYPLADDARLAVRRARVIEEPRVIPADPGVDHRLVVDREQDGMCVAGGLFLLIAGIGDFMTHAFTRVF